ncbi:hypothetical protein GGR56DRAFT_617157 [Xylariaceae sp. FL0804]|nr:hypothetical protein GGR56DRAFT_617157 [Xylariaceae sp. FL0804]
MEASSSAQTRGAAQRFGGAHHTPTQSFSEEAKFREECDIAKSRLSDQKFSSKDYPDPLLPRSQPQSHFYPKEVTAETEKHLLDVIAKIKETTA